MNINQKMSPASRITLYLICVAIGTAIGFGIANQSANQTATLDVEAQINHGTVFRIYYNNAWSEPQSAVIKPNEWTHYRFNVPSKLTSLRFDPLDEAHSQASVRQISVFGPTGKKQSVELAQMQKWIGSHLHAQFQSDANLVLLTTDDAPGYLMYAENIELASPLPLLGSFRLDAVNFFWTSVLSGAGLILIGMGRRQIKDVAIVIALLFFAATVGGKMILWRLQFPVDLPSVEHAVGAEAFAAFSKKNEITAVDLGIAIGLLLVVALCILWRWLEHKPIVPLVEPSARVPDRSYWVLLLFALCAWCAVPPFAVYLQAALHSPLPTDFDSQNVLSWEYLAHLGRLPWRDYWFPYGGFYNRLTPLFPDLLYNYLHYLALIAMLLWCGFKILRGSVRLLFACLVFFFVFQSLGIFLSAANPRYLLSLSVVLLTAVAVEEGRRLLFVLLGAWSVYVISQDLAQAFYAFPPAAILIIFVLSRTDSRDCRIRMLRAVSSGLITFAAGLTSYLILLLVRSQLREWWAFVRSLDDQAIYSAWPANVTDWMSGTGGLAVSLLVLTFALVVSGAIHVFASKERVYVYRALPFCIGLLAWLQLQKQIIRPGIETQLLAIPCLGFFLLVCQSIQQKPDIRQGSWLALSTAAITACFILPGGTLNGTIISGLQQVKGVPLDLEKVGEETSWKQAYARYFEPEHFSFSGRTGDVVLASLRRFIAIDERSPIYVLGNNPVLYILFKKPIPFYTNVYNESPIYAQQTTVSWLEREHPQHIIWDSASSEFSGVPNIIRIPLVFSYIVEHYKPQGVDEPYQILCSLKPGETLALEYWRRMLGSDTNLGYIPAASNLDEISTGGTDAAVLIVNASNPQNGSRVSIPLRVGSDIHNIDFFEKSNRFKYFIRLDRIPLLEAFRKSGFTIKLGELKNPSLNVSMRKLHLAENVLY